MLVDLSINVLASIVFFALGVGTTRLIKFIKTRGHRRFWSPFLEGRNPLAVVLTDKPGLEPRSPRKISLTDVQAFSDLRSVLGSLGKEVEIKVRSSADFSQLEKGCFVSLGGPKANGISEQVLMILGDRLPVQYNAADGCFQFGGTTFSASYDQAGRVEKDYGLIIRLLRLNKDKEGSKPVLVIFGLHGHGTEQSVKALIESKDLAVRLGPCLATDCFAFCKFEFVEHKVSKLDVLSFGSIQ